MIYQDNFEAEVKGLFGFHKVHNASLNYKLLEEACEKDFRSIENGNYPIWNIQEQGADWPIEIKKENALIMKKSTTRSTKKGRNKIRLK